MNRRHRDRPRVMEFLWAGIACLLFVAYLAGCQSVDLLLDEPAAICATDSECAAFCPPPGDEPECDGGPEA